MRDDERLFVGDAGMIVAAGATQKLVESFAAGDSILSPVTASDLDALPALFFSSGIWLLCWLVPATYRGVYDDAVSEDAPARALDAAVNAAQLRVLYELGRISVWKSKFYGAFVLNHRVVLHAIDATPARWRGDAGSSPLDGASTAASSPRNDIVKNCRVHPRHRLISTQANIPPPDADGRRRRRDRHCQRRRVPRGVAGALRVSVQGLQVSTCY